MSPIKVGFVGLSKSGWASVALGPALLANDKYTLTAVSTSSKESAEASAAKYSETTGHKVKAYYGSTEQIAKDPDVELVVVSVKTPLHKQALTPAIEAGKNFFVEWPAGKNTEETKKFAEAAKAKGLKTMVGLQGWHSPAIKKIKEIIDSGKIGKVMSTSIIALVPREAHFWGPETTASSSYILDPDQGATMLNIIIGHQLGPITHILGDFTSVSTTSTTFYPTSTLVSDDGTPTGETVQNRNPDHYAFNGILTSGALINVVWRAGYKSTPSRQQFIWEIDGEEGSIRLTSDQIGVGFFAIRYPDLYLNGEFVELERNAKTDPSGGYQGNTGAGWEEFAKGKEGVYPTIEDAVKLHQLLDAIKLSGETGKRVDL
ncbi:NAD-binding Rossmann fold oxidoreductase [Dendrothele bispora CBS 962.96]|uniref:NAD-binding Rossmann fold oxidoreductase n=1 Tax=Dendrothele bispora (strain CBS 962.96) TaxID=1314807 RepID=A0A4S8MGS1_DENBC|nr:NAD-binding Rossmann fold oxidoreductase [Dendrothele bispora CBS 962.96]